MTTAIIDALLVTVASIDDHADVDFDLDSAIRILEGVAASWHEAPEEDRRLLVARALELAAEERDPERRSFFENLEENAGLDHGDEHATGDDPVVDEMLSDPIVDSLLEMLTTVEAFSGETFDSARAAAVLGEAELILRQADRKEKDRMLERARALAAQGGGDARISSFTSFGERFGLSR
jgi:hypothetical protein